MVLLQFFRDVALLPGIWRHAVRGARGRAELAHMLAVRDAFRQAEREVGKHEGGQFGPAWEAKVATHTEAKRVFEVAWAAEIRSAEIARQFSPSAARARARHHLSPEPSTPRSVPTAPPRADHFHSPDCSSPSRGTDLRGTQDSSVDLDHQGGVR